MLDRAAHRRSDASWLAEALASPDARLVPVWRNRSLLVRPDGAKTPEPALLAPRAHADWLAARELVFLGVDARGPLFAVDLSDLEAPEVGAARFEDLRAGGAFMAAHDFGLLAYARGVCGWHRRARFCERCGAPLHARDAGFKRVCPEGHEVFPRTDPAVMVLVTRGDECLIARQPGFPKGMYSALAGFVEPGESLEECVRRETREEVGLEVDAPRYVASQGWPFPASLMLGFVAEAPTGEVALDRDELEEARWVDRATLRPLFEPGAGARPAFFVPPPMSLAHPLLRVFALRAGG
ncbi:MAG: NAD(+) diphosphatase [Myxococcales bacterium]|nr:NAD(+) diphosphatase [Myxococcales bacterium]